MQVVFRRNYMVIALVAALITGLLIPFSQVGAASKISVVKDGKALSFDVAPQIVNGRTMVPYRGIAESLGAKVAWNDKTRTVTVTDSGQTLKLTIGSKIAYKGSQRVNLDSAPIIVNGRTLVPLRFVGEALGLWVNWNGNTRTVSLESSKTIKHAMGTTKLNKVPQRVVVLFQGATDTAVMLGIKPVGAVESWTQKPWYNFLRSSMIGVRNVGQETQPNLEAVAALKPDLIIASKARHEKISGQLSSIAPTIMTANVFDWKTNLALIAPAVNKKSEGDQFMAEWNATIADFKKQMGSRLSTEVSLMRFQPSDARVWYEGGFPGLVLKELGLARPKSQQGNADKVVLTLTSQEQIPLMDGDIIFDITSDYTGDGAAFGTKNTWTKSPLWKNLKAVKNGKYIVVDDAVWNMSGGPSAAVKMVDDLYVYFDLKK
jgi:iron complex transport system substrate-binding protein